MPSKDMIPPSMESIFLILSGVILAAGVLYWFWSHIQLMQKKVQLLESAVFELRGLMTPPAPASSPEPTPSPSTEDDWATPDQGPDQDQDQVMSTPLEALDAMTPPPPELQPGGGAQVGDEAPPASDGFRELFIQHDLPSPPKAADSTSPESLDAMPVRELRRLAEQRGLTGVSDMRKKELLAALRQQITVTPPPPTVTVERTLDLEEIHEVEENSTT